jgi:hypothetical protein
MIARQLCLFVCVQELVIGLATGLLLKTIVINAKATLEDRLSANKIPFHLAEAWHKGRAGHGVSTVCKMGEG